MMIEEDIFKYYKVDFDKLIDYGFIRKEDYFIYTKLFMNDKFIAVIKIKDNGKVFGYVIDNDTHEEYYSIRIKDNVGKYVGKVIFEYEKILIDIRDNCFDNEYFMFSQTNRITKYISIKYGNRPEFLWKRDKHDGVFRNSNNNKWYGIVMVVSRDKITNGSGVCEVINLKIEPDKIRKLLMIDGYYPAYHMNKKYWISIILDDTLSDKKIEELIDESYDLVSR